MFNADLARKILDSDGFFRNHTVSVEKIEKGHVEISVPLEDGVMRLGNIMSGAAIMAFCDLASAFCVMTEDGVVNEVSSNLNTSFYRPISTGPVMFKATMRKTGSRIAYTHVEAWDAAGDLCAEATGLYYMYRQEGSR